jgi:CDP-diacylglycerol--serine O-phosphatidyltransferase
MARSRLRFLAPNLVTAASIIFGLLAVQEAGAGRPRASAWWVLYCVLADKLDGAVARLFKASSAFGMQLDSLSDFLAFGVAPATVVYGFLSRHPEIGWSEGPGLWMLRLVVVFYVICAAARLARFNIVADLQGSDRFFFGVPTTFVGGMVCALFLSFLKYGDPSWLMTEQAWDPRLLGTMRLDAGMRAMPLIMTVLALAMVSTLRVPKLGRTHILPVDIWVVVNVLFAYTAGWVRILPEWLVFGSFTYLVGSFIYHYASSARSIKLPPVFE